jgi:PPOX class probable F420-dependent enzyme
MQLHPDITAAIDAGALGHLVTINANGSPQVTMVWVGRDGDDLLVAHLGDGQKVRNVERDPRVAVSLQLPGATGIGLDHYAVLHGSATITAGGAPELLAELAPRFLGEGAVFPPMPNPPPGRIIRIVVERVTGAGPWAG